MNFDEWLNSQISPEAGPHTARYGDILNLIKSRFECDGQRKELTEFVRLAYVFGQYSERNLINERIAALSETVKDIL